MKQEAKEINYFLNSQHFTDGLRITMAILLPSMIGYYLNFLEVGLTLSLGSLCASFADAPGPIIHRKNGMLFCIVFIFISSVVTSFAKQNIYTLGLEIAVFSFFFSMFNVYGTRATSVGNAALLVMILDMDKPIPASGIFLHALFIALGGIWYMFVSLLFYNLRPYRVAQRALGECIRELAHFLSVKALFYDCNTNLEEDYRKLMAQQIVVSEKQDALREILFKTRQIVKETTLTGRKLVLTFVDTVDLFEDITATYYDYTLLRKQYGDTGILNEISALLKTMAHELDNVGIAIQTNTTYKTDMDYEAALQSLKTKMEAIARQESDESNLVLKKIRVNIRRMMLRFSDIVRYFDAGQVIAKRNNKLEYSRFVGHQSLDPKILRDNLSFQSAAFKHALRVALACMAGFIIAKLIASGHHSYWIVMTITFMLKPTFSLTKQRNYNRIAGTIIGGTIGILILWLIPNHKVQFAIMVLLMIATYSFQRTKYFLMVIVMTPFILILFKFLGISFISVAQERITDTAIGCCIAFLAGYLLFPIWESEQLKKYMKNMLLANGHYLQKILEGLSGLPISLTEYKLARKNVYVSSANLSAAFQRMLSEPKNKQKNEREIHQFVVLNHILFSNIAALANAIMYQPVRAYPEDMIRSAKKSLNKLCDSIQQFDKDCGLPVSNIATIKSEGNSNYITNADDMLIKEQLDFLYRICKDINKTTLIITASETTAQPTHSLLVPNQ